MSARGRTDNFTRDGLLDDLRSSEPVETGYDNSDRDEREVPLLANTTNLGEVTSPPMVQDVILVDEKEMPADAPEASEVV